MRKLILAVIVTATMIFTPLASGSSQPTHAITHHDRQVLRFFTHHPRLARTPAGERALWLLITHVVRDLDRTLQSAQVVWPPHHSLWLCIHSGEAGWQQPSHAMGYVDGVYTSLYWGGMQMHQGWGYGTSYHASDDSQMTQEWAAEKAYKSSNYSSSFLWQQWAADAHCFS